MTPDEVRREAARITTALAQPLHGIALTVLCVRDGRIIDPADDGSQVERDCRAAAQLYQDAINLCRALATEKSP